MRQLSGRPKLPTVIHPSRLSSAIVIADKTQRDDPPRDFRKAFIDEEELLDVRQTRQLFTRTQFLSLDRYRQRQAALTGTSEASNSAVSDSSTRHDIEITVQVTPERSETTGHDTEESLQLTPERVHCPTSPALSLFCSDGLRTDEDEFIVFYFTHVHLN